MMLASLVLISGTSYALAQLDDMTPTMTNSLTVQENNSIARSINSYEVSTLKVSDTKYDIENDQFTVDFKGEQYLLNLIPDENLNSAEFYIEIDGENVLQKNTPTAYVGYVVGKPGSIVSIIVSDDSVSGFINTGDKEISIEPLSFRGNDFSGEKQILYEMTDLNFEFSLENDVPENESIVTPTNVEIDSFFPMAEAHSGHSADLRLVTDADYYNINTSTCASRALTIVGGMNTEFASTNVSLNLLSYACNQSYLDSSAIGGNLSDLKNQFDGSGTSPSRDLYFALLGGDKDYSIIGQASDVPGIDNVQYQGYAVAQMVDDSGSDYDASSTEQKIVATNEVAHVIGASHTSSKIGSDYTIMYGGVLDDSNVTLDFHSGSKTLINSAAEDYL